MKTFGQDLSQARAVELQETIDRLKVIGDESQRAETLPERRADEVRRALSSFSRKELPLAIVAGLVDLTYERVRQIAVEMISEQALEDTKDVANLP